MKPRTVVLLPGTLVPPSIYAATARLLEAGGAFRAVAVDWMREVPSPTLETVADHVASLLGNHGAAAGEPGPAIVVGHSTGGAAAAMLALRHPGLAAGLVLLDSGPDMRAHASIGDMLARLRDADDDAWRAFAGQNVSSGDRARWIREMVEYSRLVGAGPACSILESQFAQDFAGFAPLPLPVEALHGELDPKRGPGDAAAWRRLFPRTELRVLPGVGHTPPLEDPGAVAEAVERVAARL